MKNVIVRSAFTLAEMMVVLLIMTIILAAMAPVMTRRMNSSSSMSSPWTWSVDTPGSAYTVAKSAMIGQKKQGTNDKNAKLVINSDNNHPSHILFKNNNNVLGLLEMGNPSDVGQFVLLGTKAEGSSSPTRSVSVGFNQSLNAWNTVAIGIDNEILGQMSNVIGTNAKIDGDRNLAIGWNVSTKGDDLIALGNLAGIYGQKSIYIDSIANWVKAKNSIFIKGIREYGCDMDTCSEVDSVVALGGQALKKGSVAVGINSFSLGEYGVAIGGVLGELNTEPQGYIHTENNGDYGVAIGYNAQVSGNSDSGIAIGNSAKILGLHSNSSIVIGKNARVENAVNSVAIGPNALNTVSNSIVLGSTSNSKVRVNGTLEYTGSLSQTSDRRLKYVGKENTSGLDKIKQLKVFNYTFKKDKTKTPHVGVIAQDLQKVFPHAVSKGPDGFLTIRMEDMFYAVINAIKELDAKVTTLIKQENDKDKKIKELEKRIELLESKIK